MGPTQELTQGIAQRYGWSCVIEREDDGRWICTVTVGLKDRHQFASEDTTSVADTQEGLKKGTAAASEVALEGLQEEIRRQEAKPVRELTDIFPAPIDVYESNRENWEYFWNHKPAAVGIDVEGNQISPPVLVQISTDDYTIIEAPTRGGLSKDLVRLLRDDSVVKVFCDNFAHKDKICLGLADLIPNNGFIEGHVVDLEALATKVLGPVKVARGLSRIIVLSMPDEINNALIQKPTSKGRFKNVGRFCLIEQGKKPPLKSIRQLSEKELQYAALDSWCTLQAYKHFRKAMMEHTS